MENFFCNYWTDPYLTLCPIFRSWSGLEQKLGETSIEPLVHGRTGIAQGYQGEGET